MAFHGIQFSANISTANKTGGALKWPFPESWKERHECLAYGAPVLFAVEILAENCMPWKAMMFQ